MEKGTRLMMLQPGYLPWIGFFEQAYRTDSFVVYDDAQFTKQDWRNRNQIKGPKGRAEYITVPVKKSPVETPIREIEISYEQGWVKRHLNLLRQYYSRAPYFEMHAPGLFAIISKKYRFLIDLDMELTRALLKALKIETRIVMSSSLKTPVRGKQRLLAVCQEMGATYCYNGKAGEQLYSKAEFMAHGVHLEFQDFKCPAYPQLWGRFIPNLSIIDALFNCGNQTIEIIAGTFSERT
jgi:hypothetical protein